MWKIEKLVKKGEYMYAVVKDHPYRTKNNYVLAHRVIMENHLGRLLNNDEVVHHKDGNKLNNDLSNLEVMNAKEHVMKHQRLHGRKWAELQCPWCGKHFMKPLNATFIQKKAKYTCCSMQCRGKMSSEIKHHGLTPELETAISNNLVRMFTKYSEDDLK